MSRPAARPKLVQERPQFVLGTSYYHEMATALEATQGQMDRFFGQLPHKCHFEDVASVGDWLQICPEIDSRVALDQRSC